MAARKGSADAAASLEAAADPDTDLPYEQARDALAEIVARLEAGNLTLEESLALWERGEVLAAVCRARLDGARARLDAATSKED